MNSLVKVFNSAGRAIKRYSLERAVWCLLAIGFCWMEVDDYHLFKYLQEMYFMIGTGIFYCIKKGAFRVKKLPFTIPIMIITGCLIKYCNQVYFFKGYSFYNTAVPILAAVTVLLYILAISECFEQRKVLSVGEGCILVLLLSVSIFLSVHEWNYFYILVVCSMLPYAIFLGNKESQRHFMKGIADGICIGIWVVQGYAWRHRPYNAYEMRYSGATTLCIYSARIYLLGFSAWLTKYVECSKQQYCKLISVQGVKRLMAFPAWLISAFILAIVYMTGNRGTVVAMVIMAAIAMSVRYIRAVEISPKKIMDKCKGLAAPVGKSMINLGCLGCVSLMLFPVAFMAARWLPAYYNEPDYIDSCGNRYLSYMTQEIGETFLYNNEYRDDAVKKNDNIYSIKYITYYECLCFNIGRLIPGMNEYFYEVLGEAIWNTRAYRIETFYDAGYYSEADYEWYWKELKEDFENQYVGGSTFADVGDGSFELPFKELIYKVLGKLLLYLDAEELNVTAASSTGKIYPGDTPEYPWSTSEELQNGLGERAAIYSYAIRHLNLEGHKDDAFKFYQTEDVTQGHAHNIFLQMGYDFGIISMIVFCMMFLAVILIGAGDIREGMFEYMCPVLLLTGFAVFGMFDVGFSVKNGMTAMIILISMCVRRRKNVEH